MISSAYGGVSIYLLDIAPEWGSGVKADVSVVAQFEGSLNNREARRPHALTLRFRTGFSIDVSGPDARRVAGGLRTLTTEPVVIPFWPSLTTWALRGGSPISAGLKIVFKADWSQWALYEGVEPGWPAADDCWAPVLWGRLEERKPNWVSPDRLTFAVDHSEASKAAWALTPAAVVFGVGPALGWGTPKWSPFDINFDSRPEDYTISILREQIGFGRVPAETLYPQAVAREQEMGHFLESVASWAELLEFFRQHGGGKPFWSSSWVSSAVLTADVGVLDTVVQVLDTGAIQVGDWVAFGEASGAMVGELVDGKTSNTITLHAAVGAWPAGTTLVTGLLLARFSKPAITLQWRSNEYVECRLPLRELPAEYVPAAEETVGTTLGLLATRCYLYEFSWVLGGVTYTDRFTSFENDLTYGGHTYVGNAAGKSLSHGDIVTRLYLERNEVELRSDLMVPSLVSLATMKMESPLGLSIIQAETDGAAASNATVIFTGEVVKVGPRGNRLVAKAAPAGSLFDRLIPRFMFQLGCNHTLFDVGCGLVKADWQFSAVMHVAPAGGYPFSYVLEGFAGVGANAVAALAAGAVGGNYFAGGWAEFGVGATMQRRAVLVNSPAVAGAIYLNIDRDVLPLPGHGVAVVLYPGCDLSASTCADKFGNYLNFGGHPLMPIANPSMVRPSQSNAGGKK